MARLSVSDHYILSHSILTALKCLKSSELNEVRSAITESVLSGVYHHLEAVDNRIRDVGLISGQLALSMLNEDAPKFEIDETRLVSFRF